MAIEPHDFRQPVRLQSDVEERLTEWMTAACVGLGETCERYMPFELRSSVSRAQTARWSNFFPNIDPTCIGWRVAFGTEDRDTLVIMRRPMMQVLVGGLLGDTFDAIPEDEPLTPATEKVAKFFIDYFVRAVRENWPGGDAGHILMRQEESVLKRQRVIQSEESIVICEFHFTGPFGEEPWYWLIPYETILALFDAIESAELTAQSKTERQLLEALVNDMNTEMSVRLGAIQLNAQQLKSLQPGDVLVLDQRLNEPLTAKVATEDAFRVWPGRTGLRQALQVESLVEG